MNKPNIHAKNAAVEIAALRASMRKLNRIGAALSAEHDLDKLLEKILSSARELTGSDAGSLYLIEKPVSGGRRLGFKVAQNDSVDYDFSAETVDLDHRSIAGYVALSGETLNLGDVRLIDPAAPYKFNLSFDDATGYTTASMLAVPMKNHHDEVIGVLQLINRRVAPLVPLGRHYRIDEVQPYGLDDEEIAQSLAGQAAVAIENSSLYLELSATFDAFVRASVTAIESRDPTTAGHSERVARLTVGLARAVERSHGGLYGDMRFTDEHLSQIEYASLLHDFGKIGVRENVLVKATKLFPHELDSIEYRAREAALRMRLHTASTQLARVRTAAEPEESIDELEERLSQRLEVLKKDVATIRRANDPSPLDNDAFQNLKAASMRRLDVPGCDILTLLSDEESRRLGIRRGSLSEAERREIESHVDHTHRYLQSIPWPRGLRRVPEIAHAHHEKMNGGGYPRGLSGKAIPIEARMMTISDIFDALTAVDRPYKNAVPLHKALDILESEAQHGALDKELLRIFIEAQVYRSVLRDA